MRDPNRIDTYIETLRRIWKKHPDLRLGQLITNMNTTKVSLFYVEEDKLDWDAWLAKKPSIKGSENE